MSIASMPPSLPPSLPSLHTYLVFRGLQHISKRILSYPLSSSSSSSLPSSPHPTRPSLH